MEDVNTGVSTFQAAGPAAAGMDITWTLILHPAKVCLLGWW